MAVPTQLPPSALGRLYHVYTQALHCCTSQNTLGSSSLLLSSSELLACYRPNTTGALRNCPWMGRRDHEGGPSTSEKKQDGAKEADAGSKNNDGNEQASAQASAARKRPPAIASALSGALSGALISACVQPLDVLRTRMQADASKGVFRSTVATFQLIIREGGVRGLWRGTGPTVIRLSCGAAVNMVVLERLKGALLQQLENGATHLSSTNAAIVGGLSRAVSAACMSPVTLVKTRMEYGGPDGAQYRNTLHALQTIVKQDGVRGLFRGMGPTVLTNAPFSALYYMFYTRMKGFLAAEDRPQTLVNFGSAVTAAVAATMITQPTDVVRTRMQLALAGTTKGNALQTMAHVFASQGPKALLSGAAPRVLKRTTQTALVWTLYEELLPKLSALWLWTEQLATQSVSRPAEGGSAASAGS